MAFSEWQEGRLRARLAAYRLNSGKTRLELTQDILDCESTGLSIPDDEEDPTRILKAVRNRTGTATQAGGRAAVCSGREQAKKQEAEQIGNEQA